jgi:hypothetical protein
MVARQSFNPAQFSHIHINYSGDICCSDQDLVNASVSFAAGLATTPPLGIVPT